MTYAAPLAVLKTDTRMTPINVWCNQFAEKGLVAYLVTNVVNGKVKMVTSWGHLGEGMEIGDTVTLVGDQSGRNLGRHLIVGIIDLSTDVRYIAKNTSWDAFKRSYPHYVVK